MMGKLQWKLLPLVMALFISTSDTEAWGSSSEKVLLKDVSVLTLYTGKITTGRRSTGVPQLKCIGGTAGCTSFVPQVVQCTNKGSDGFDIQWECKSDMDNAYRFGKIQVSCEGFDYPDDPYVLRGSCGLEYTLDFTKEGMTNQGSHHHNYYGDNSNSYGWKDSVYPNANQYTKGQGSGAFTNIACLIVVVIIVYAIYKTCIVPAVDPTRQRSRTNDDYPDSRGPRSQPPPPGFNPSYYPNDNSNTGFSSGDSCGGGATRGGNAGSGAGGFWTGAATGGLLGYLFGNRNNTGGYGYGGNAYARPSYGFTSGRSASTSWGGGSSSGYSSGGGSSSSGTRTASGFGGTTRR